MDAFDFIKETTGGATVIETINSSTEEYFFGANMSPTFRKKSTSLVIEIGRYTFTVPVSNTIRINTGSGLSTFSGTVAQLKAALIPVFPKANGGGGSAVSSLDDVPDSDTRLALTVSERSKLSNTSGVNSGDETADRINALYGYAPANQSAVTINTSDIGSLVLAIGTLSSLNTIDQSNLVNAINELKAAIQMAAAGDVKGNIVPASAAIVPTANDSYRLNGTGTYTNFLSAAVTPITFNAATEGIGIIQYNTATGYWTKITAPLSITLQKTVTSIAAPIPDQLGQLGKDSSGRLYVAIATSGTEVWRRLVRASDFQMMYEPWFGTTLGIVKMSDSSIKFVNSTSTYLLTSSPIQLQCANGDYTFTFSATSKILCLDTTKTFTSSTVYRVYQVGGANNALVEKVAADIVDSNLVPLCGYYNSTMFGFPIGNYLATTVVTTVMPTVTAINSPVPSFIGQLGKDSDGRKYIARATSGGATNGPTAEYWEKLVRPSDISMMLEPYTGTTLSVIETATNTIKFLGANSIFFVSTQTIQLEAGSGDYTFTFSAANKVLAIDTTKNWVVSGAYRKYQAGGVNNCLVETTASALTDTTLIPVAGYYNSAIFGFVLGNFLEKQRISRSSGTPYTTNLSKVVSNALSYTKDELNSDNYMFVQVNDIHTSNGNTGRVENFTEALAFVADAASSIPLKFGISNGDIADGLRSTKAAFQLDVDTYKSIYDTTSLLWLNTIGNHDDNSNANLFAEVYTKADQRSNFIDPIVTKFPSAGVTVGPATSACYYYFDDATFKIRNIVLDPLDIPYVANGSALKYKGLLKYAFSNTQLNWLAGTALNLSALTTPTQWSVNIFCHIPIRNTGLGEFQHPTSIIPRIINAFKNGTTVTESFTDTVNGGDFSYSVTKDFTALNGAGANFIGYFSGHRHNDYINADTEFTDQKNIIVNNAWTLRDYATTGSKVNRALNTITQNSFDVMIIDKNARKVRALRFGAGQDAGSDPVFIFQRSFTY